MGHENMLKLGHKNCLKIKEEMKMRSFGFGKDPSFFFSFSGRVRTGSKTKVRLGTCADAAAI